MTHDQEDHAQGNTHEPTYEVCSPLIVCVNSLIVEMCRTHGPSRSIRRSDWSAQFSRLPMVELTGGFDFSHVVNRLKIMSNLNPMTYQKPVEGHFRVRALGKNWRAKTLFDDMAEDPRFSLSIEEEDDNGSPPSSWREVAPLPS